jgi:hypothetical protein
MSVTKGKRGGTAIAAEEAVLVAQSRAVRILEAAIAVGAPALPARLACVVAGTNAESPRG